MRASPIIGANLLELWTIIIRFRMVWILLGNKVTEAGGDKVVGLLLGCHLLLLPAGRTLSSVAR